MLGEAFHRCQQLPIKTLTGHLCRAAKIKQRYCSRIVSGCFISESLSISLSRIFKSFGSAMKPRQVEERPLVHAVAATDFPLVYISTKVYGMNSLRSCYVTIGEKSMEQSRLLARSRFWACEEDNKATLPSALSKAPDVMRLRGPLFYGLWRLFYGHCFMFYCFMFSAFSLGRAEKAANSSCPLCTLCKSKRKV